jgi:siroheme synthase-like protein
VLGRLLFQRIATRNGVTTTPEEMQMSAWSETMRESGGFAPDEATPASERTAREDSSHAGRETPLFPVALRLVGRRVLVVGGGPIALRKVTDLLAAGARVRVVAPAFGPGFADLAGIGGARLQTLKRRFAPEDADGSVLVIAATDDPATQRAAADAAEERGLFCNVVDVTGLCTFHVPAVLRRGSLSISVATDGTFPLLAVALRDRLASVVGEAFAPALDRLAAARLRARAAYPDDQAARAEALRALLTPEALDELLEGRLGAFEARVAAWEAALASNRATPAARPALAGTPERAGTPALARARALAGREA